MRKLYWLYVLTMILLPVILFGPGFWLEVWEVVRDGLTQPQPEKPEAIPITQIELKDVPVLLWGFATLTALVTAPIMALSTLFGWLRDLVTKSHRGG